MKTILIADDEESLRTLIETTLEAPGLRILHACNGPQAMDLARAEHPDLILLDRMMPGITGIEVAEALRAQSSTADISILVLTGRDRDKDRHTEIGAEVLAGSRSPLIELARRIALTHHERWDGTGYPHGLKGLEIPLAGRVVMLVDQYDALRATRPYKPAFTRAQACRVMLEGDGRTLPRHFDPLFLAAFREIHANFDGIHARHADGSGSFPQAPQTEVSGGRQNHAAVEP